MQDTLCTIGLQTTAGSQVLEGYQPSYDATSVARLRAAGALLAGKCNCDAFAMGSTTESSDYHVRAFCQHISLSFKANCPLLGAPEQQQALPPVVRDFPVAY